jgi:hypothetical protein
MTGRTFAWLAALDLSGQLDHHASAGKINRRHNGVRERQ